MSDEIPSPAAGASKAISIRVIGVGGAGGNSVSHMAQAGLDDVSFAVLNTDTRALEGCAVSERIVVGAAVTRGLGSGGDPEVGRAAAEADVERMRSACAGADIVFVVAGLGGGTGTGAAPVLARVAREAGALVLAVVTLPFEFEGARRQRQASLGLQQLKSSADAVITLPNQKLFKLIDTSTSVLETFKISNELLAEGVRGIWRLLTRTGLIHVDFADLCAVTRGRHAESAFAFAAAGGEGRAQQVMEKLLAHPLLEAGPSSGEPDAVLVSIVGGSDLTMGEVNKVMEQVNRQFENAHVIMGAAIDPALGDKISVTAIASRGGPPERGFSEAPADAASMSENRGGSGENLLGTGRTLRPASRFIPPAPLMTEERKEQLLTRQNGRGRKGAGRSRQRELPLEIISKGRFEKSEPTIHQGEDLDVPTYIRRGVLLN